MISIPPSHSTLASATEIGLPNTHIGISIAPLPPLLPTLVLQALTSAGTCDG
jgi:hypothetical protein